MESWKTRWQILYDEMIASGEFHPDGLTVTQLMRDYLSHRAVVRTEGDRIVSYGAVQIYPSEDAHLHGPYCELRRIWVAPRLRKTSRLCEDVVEMLLTVVRMQGPNGGRPFCITKSLALGCVVGKYDFKPMTTLMMPHVGRWSKKIGLGDRLPDTALGTDMANPLEGERWLYLKVG